MQHERDAQDLERAARELGPARGRRGWQAIAFDVREIDATAFEYAALLEHATFAAAAFGALPYIASEHVTVDRLQARDDARLQAGKVIARGGEVHRRHSRVSPCARRSRDDRCPCD